MSVFAMLMVGWLGFATPASLTGRSPSEPPSLEVKAEVKAVPAGTSCVGAPQGLIAWWTLDETTGTTSRDLVSAQHGQHVGHPLPVSGVVDGALSFDGLHDYVEVPAELPPQPRHR